MDKKLITVENHIRKEYDILAEFTSNDTKKQYVIYTDGNTIYTSYYKLEKGLYILQPIVNEEEIEMCKNIINDIRG